MVLASDPRAAKNGRPVDGGTGRPGDVTGAPLIASVADKGRINWRWFLAKDSTMVAGSSFGINGFFFFLSLALALKLN